MRPGTFGAKFVQCFYWVLELEFAFLGLRRKFRKIWGVWRELSGVNLGYSERDQVRVAWVVMHFSYLA